MSRHPSTSPSGPLAEDDRRRLRDAMVARIRAGKPNPFEPSSPAHAAYAFTKELLGHAERAPQSPVGWQARRILSESGRYGAASTSSTVTTEAPVESSTPPLPAAKPSGTLVSTPPIPGVRPEGPHDPFRSPHRPFDPIHRAFADALFGKESRGSGGYRAKNESTGPRYAAYGRYQFQPAALIDLGFMNRSYQWTGLYGIDSEDDFFDRSDVQDYALSAHMRWVRSDLSRKDDSGFSPAALIGQRVVLRRPNGDVSFVITESGLLAAAHREGVGGLRSYLKWLQGEGFVSDPSAMPKLLEGPDAPLRQPRHSYAASEAWLQEFAAIPYIATSSGEALGETLP